MLNPQPFPEEMASYRLEKCNTQYYTNIYFSSWQVNWSNNLCVHAVAWKYFFEHTVTDSTVIL